MRYLLLSDIHANLEALEASLDSAQGDYDQVLCLGDLVGYGPDPNAVIDRVRAVTRVVIRGNHDKACSNLTDAEDFNSLARFATEWTQQQLTVQNLDYLSGLPQGPLKIGEIQLVHGSPRDEDEYLSGPIEALPALRSSAAPLTFFGHTHVQGGFILTTTERFQVIRPPHGPGQSQHEIKLHPQACYLVNPGSVGQPRDGDWRAAFAIYDDARRAVEFRRVLYPLKTTQDKMLEAGLPEMLAMRLQLGR